MSEQQQEEDDNIYTQHLTLNVVNMIPNMGGVPLVWGVLLLGSAMILAVFGFIVTNSLTGALFGLPSLIIFYVVKFICINSLDALRVFQLKVAGKYKRFKRGGGAYQLSPSLKAEQGGSDAYEQVKRAKEKR